MIRTQIRILGQTYYLWIRGTKDQETGEYQDWLQTWEANDMLNLSWFITEEEDKDAHRVAFVDGQVNLVPREEQGSAFGYIWCTREGMQGRGQYAHGLVGMRYGWEKAKDTVFKDASSLEFSWRLAVSRRIWQFINFKKKQMTAPAPMQQQAQTLEDKPELFKTKISELSFREKLQRYLRKPTTKVYEAIVEEFTTLTPERKQEIISKLQGTTCLNAPHMQELFDELSTQVSVSTSDLPAGL